MLEYPTPTPKTAFGKVIYRERTKSWTEGTGNSRRDKESNYSGEKPDRGEG